MKGVDEVAKYDAGNYLMAKFLLQCSLTCIYIDDWFVIAITVH